jgi:hypothetical protein
LRTWRCSLRIAIGEGLVVEPELGRDRLDQLLIGVFHPGRDRAGVIAKLRAGPSVAVQPFATLAAFQARGGKIGQPMEKEP